MLAIMMVQFPLVTVCDTIRATDSVIVPLAFFEHFLDALEHLVISVIEVNISTLFYYTEICLFCCTEEL